MKGHMAYVWRDISFLVAIPKSLDVIFYDVQASIYNRRSVFNTLTQRQIYRHFADDLYNWFFVNENLIIWLKFHWRLFEVSN